MTNIDFDIITININIRADSFDGCSLFIASTSDNYVGVHLRINYK